MQIHLTKHEQMFADTLRESLAELSMDALEIDRAFKQIMVKTFPRLNPNLVWFRYEPTEKDGNK